MSFFIETNTNLESPPIIDVPVRRILPAKIRKIIKPMQQNSTITNNQIDKQQRMLQKLCQKLTDRQFQQIHNKNAVQMQRQFTKLKHNLNSSFKAQSVERIMDNKPKTVGRLNIGKINQIWANPLDLNKKYHDVFSYKVYCLREAQKIDRQKQSYREWMNSQRNNYLTSPNFQKMIFMIQKVKKMDGNDQSIRNAKRILFQHQGQKQLNKSLYKINNTTNSFDKTTYIQDNLLRADTKAKRIDKENQQALAQIKSQRKLKRCILKQRQPNRQIGSQRKRQILLQISHR